MVDCPRDDIRDLLPDLVHDQLGTEARLRVERHLEECDECAAELELLRALRATAFPTPDVDADRIAAAVRAEMAATRSGTEVGNPEHGDTQGVDTDGGAAADDADVVHISVARGRSSRSRSATGARGTSPRPARRSIPQSWRIAAGIALVAAGAGGYALTHDGARPVEPRAEQASAAATSKSARGSEPFALSAKAGAPAPAATADVADATGSGVDAATLTPGPLILGDAVNELSESDMQALLQSVDDLQAMPDLEPHQLPLLASVVEGAL